jgi:hypothetical protein
VINAILPLTLKSFDAKILGKKTELYWETEQEDANTVFYVERSKDAIDFKNIGTVQGTNTSGSTYHYTDESISKGTSWYRLKMTGQSGIKYSETRQVHHSTTRFGIDNVQLSSASLTIHLHSEIAGNMEVYLVSSSGVRLQAKKQKLLSPATQVSLNISQLPPGAYYLVISTGKEFITQPVYLFK